MIDSIAFYVSILRRQFTAYCTEKLSEMDITQGQIFIIIYIGKRERCSPKDISQALKIDAGHLNRVLTKLIENEFVMQIKNKKDKRANIVSLTTKGKQVFKRSHELFHEWDEKVLSSLEQSEKQKLMDLLKKVTVYQNENKLDSVIKNYGRELEAT